jgi:hypothetical protein
MLDDSDISSTRHARAFVAGALAGLIGHAEVYVPAAPNTRARMAADR